MNTLILGGTKFIGRHIVEHLLAAGHRVSILTRGQTPDELPLEVERLRGDRDLGAAGLAALAGRSWDACVDVSGYTAIHVRASAELLRARVGRYVYISAVASYGDPQNRPVREDHPQMPLISEEVTELDMDTYGRLKATCETIVRGLYADRCTVLRPQITVGPGDPSGRYTYWLQRARGSGEMLAPGDGSDHLQVIDVRDLARFACLVVERNTPGVFNTVGPRFTWAEFMRILGVKNPVWVPAKVIHAAGVTEFDLPLFRSEHGPKAGIMHVSNERALAAGLTLTNPAATAADTLAWMAGKDIPLMLPPQREAELIALTRARAAGR